MNQNEQMREALQKAEVEMRYAGWANYVHDNFGRHEAYRTAQQALATEPDHIPDDTKMVQPAPLVRLTEKEISQVWTDVKASQINQVVFYANAVSHYANAIMDAMIKKNGGTID